jgi:SNF2 family DNA or RNA helicase
MNLFKHQSEAIKFITANGGLGAIYHEMGLGKTRSALEIYRHYRQTEPHLKLLVICPISLIEGAWGEDIRKFTDYTYKNLHKNDLEFKTDIYLINFEAFISKKQMLAQRLAKEYPLMCVIDESSKIKSFSALTTKRILATRNLYRYRIVMSGTPAPNTEMEYWPQMQFVRPTIFPDNFYKFRNTYFCLSRGSQVMHGQILNKASARDIFSKGWKYAIQPAKKVALMSRISLVSHFAKKIDCLDLPEQVDEVRKIEMTPDQRKHYKEMANEAITYIQDNAVVAQVALAKIMKLRQITSSFALAQEAYVEIPGCPKTKELCAVLEEAGSQQAIIWCNFHAEIYKLKNLLGDKAVCLYGETKDKQEPIDAFKSGRAQYLIAHPKSAAYGLTFTNASLQIFFSLDYSYESYVQAKSRTHRAGQLNKCTYIHLICDNSIDETILAVLQRKGKEEEIVYEWIRNHAKE